MKRSTLLLSALALSAALVASAIGLARPPQPLDATQTTAAVTRIFNRNSAAQMKAALRFNTLIALILIGLRNMRVNARTRGAACAD